MVVVRLDEAGRRTKTNTRIAAIFTSTMMLFVSRRLANAPHQHHRQQHHDQERRNVEPEMPARADRDRCPRGPAAPSGRYAGEIHFSAGWMSEPVQQSHHVRREPHAHAHVRERILEDQVPADDPRDQLAHRRVGVGVRRPRNRDHRRQLRVAEPRERAHDRHQHQRQAPAPDPRRAAPPSPCAVMQIVESAECSRSPATVELLPRRSPCRSP